MTLEVPPQIMTIDDELAITESLKYTLGQAGFAVCTANSLKQARELFQQHHESLQLLILDLILPDGHGFDFLKELRKVSQIPVIILSSHDDEIEHIVGLEIGADDYVDKPFSTREVLARVRSLLRRIGYQKTQSHLQTSPIQSLSLAMTSSEDPVHITTNDTLIYHYQDLILSIDSLRHEVFLQQTKIQLSQLEFDLLAFLVRHKGIVYSRGNLLKEVWGKNITVNERTVDVHIKTLRKKVHQAGLSDFIETIRGIGYKVVDL
jgi:DNA-binding response OmpR family regulator